MKRYNDLTDLEKEKALERARTDLLHSIFETDGQFLPDYLIEVYNKACIEAEKMFTPWFTHEYLLDNKDFKDWLDESSKTDIEEAYYPERGELCIYI